MNSSIAGSARSSKSNIAWFSHALPDAGLRGLHPVAGHGGPRGVPVEDAPHLYLIDDDAVANLDGWVTGGGTLLTTFFSGIVDPADRVRPGAYPGAFRELLGLRVEEFVPLANDQANRVVTDGHEPFGATLWSDVIDAREADVLARFGGDFFAGSPAVTRNRRGAGAAYHVGTNLDEGGLAWLIGLVSDAAGVRGPGGTVRAGGQLELVERFDGADRWLFALIHGGSAAEIALDRPAVDVIRGALF